MGVYPHSSPSSASGRTRKACRASPTETSSVNSTQFPVSAPNPFLGDGWGLAPPGRFCEHPQQAELRVRGGCLYPPPQPAAPLRGGSGLAVRGRPGRWRWVPACSRSARGPLPAETAAARSVGGTGTGPFSQPSWSSPGSTLGLGAFTPPQSVNISGFLVFFFFFLCRQDTDEHRLGSGDSKCRQMQIFAKSCGKIFAKYFSGKYNVY